MKKNQKVISILLVIFFILLNGFLILNSDKFQLDFEFIIKYIISTIITIGGAFLLYICNKKQINIKKQFIVCYVIIGLLYLFLFPITSLPDEINHFYRGYEISNGNLTSDKVKQGKGYIGGSQITKSVQEVIHADKSYDKVGKVLFKKDDNKKTSFEPFTNISLYSFVCYTPQALGILFGRILNLPILFWAYLARLFNFALFVFLLGYSIKHIPYKKTTLMFIALLPMTFQIAISMSADCMTMGVSMALISYILELRYNKKEKMKKKDYIILSILSITLSLCKITYLPICLLLFLIPKDKFKNNKEKIIKIGAIFIVSIISNLVWLSIASQYLAALNNSDLQLKFILSNPFEYIYIICNTILIQFDWYVNSAFGGSLGLFCVNVSPLYINLCSLIFLLLILFDNKKVKIDNYLRFSSFIIFGLICGLIATSLYLDWTSYKSLVIDGIQGRYFLPIFIFIFIFLSNNWFELKNKQYLNKEYLILFMLIENIYALTLISLTY